MENTVQGVANKLSAWQASGGALTDPMNAPIVRSDQHLASAASTTGGPSCPTGFNPEIQSSAGSLGPQLRCG